MSNKRNRQLLEQKWKKELVQGKIVIAGISGGADSMALLHILHENGVDVRAAHVNHGLRGAAGDRDEQYVKDYCAAHGIPFFVRHLDIRALAERDHLGEEECGRRERYAFFGELRREAGENALIATAHTLSDQLETMLFRMARGTGLTGLCGILPARGYLVRPLLDCTRQEIEDYCRRHDLKFVTDATNADPAYARNRIRLEAVPALKKVNPAVEIHSGQLAESLREDSEFLEQEARKLFDRASSENGLRTEILGAAPKCLAVRAAAIFLEKQGVSGDFGLLREITELAQKGKGTLNLPGGKKLEAGGGLLYLPRNVSEIFSTEIILPGTPEYGKILGIVPFPDGRKLILRAEQAGNFENIKKIYNSDLIFLLDYDTIIGRLVFRNRFSSDTIGLKGRPGNRLLKKLYSEQGLSPEQRRFAAAAADGEGIVWAEYIGPAEKNVPASHTSRLLIGVIGKEYDNYDGTGY